MTTYKIFCIGLLTAIHAMYTTAWQKKKERCVCNGRDHHTPMAGDATNPLPVNWPLLLLLLSAVIPLS